MTKVIFIFKNIFHFFASDKILWCLILVGMIICDTIFFVFGNILWSDTKIKEYEIYENNVVTLSFDNLDIDKFLELTGNKDYITSTFFEYKILREDSSAITISAYDPSFDFSKNKVELGNGLSRKKLEFVMSDNYVRNSNFSNMPLVKIGDVLHFLNNDWICAGIVSTSLADNFDILINIDDFKSHVAENITANFRYQNGTSLIEIQNFSNLLKDEFNAKSVLTPNKTVSTSFTSFLSEMSGILLLLAIAIINYMFLYRFLLVKRTYTYGIYKLYGMNNRLTLISLSIELLILLLLSYSLSILVYYGGSALIVQTNTITQYKQELFFAFIVIIILNLLFFFLTAFKVVNHSPTELIRESVVS